MADFAWDCKHTGPKRNSVMYCKENAELVTAEECQECWTFSKKKPAPTLCSHCGGTGRAPDPNDDYPCPVCHGKNVDEFMFKRSRKLEC